MNFDFKFTVSYSKDGYFLEIAPNEICDNGIDQGIELIDKPESSCSAFPPIHAPVGSHHFRFLVSRGAEYRQDGWAR
jgi:hypothetical protein